MDDQYYDNEDDYLEYEERASVQLKSAIIQNDKKNINALMREGFSFDRAMRELFGKNSIETFKDFESEIEDYENNETMYLNLIKVAYNYESKHVVEYLNKKVITQDALSAVKWLYEKHNILDRDFIQSKNGTNVSKWLLSLDLEKDLPISELKNKKFKV